MPDVPLEQVKTVDNGDGSFSLTHKETGESILEGQSYGSRKEARAAFVQERNTARERQVKPSKYFNHTPKSTNVPLKDLLSSEPALDEARVARARANMDAAAVGAGEKRKPLAVYRRNDGKLVVLDGNTTLSVLRERGEQNAVVEIKKSIKQPKATMDEIYADAAKADAVLRKSATEFATKTGGRLVSRPGGQLKERERTT